MAASATTLPLGSEIVPSDRPVAGGSAPWEREGGLHQAPDAPESRAKAERWRQRAAVDSDPNPDSDRDNERRRRAVERRARRREEAEAERVKTLEKNARRMYWLGFFALPLLWLVSLLYFHKDYKSPEPNPVIKYYYKNSRFMLILYTIIFTTWFVVFQIYSDTALKSMNILFYAGKSPSGF